MISLLINIAWTAGWVLWMVLLVRQWQSDLRLRRWLDASEAVTASAAEVIARADRELSGHDANNITFSPPPARR